MKKLLQILIFTSLIFSLKAQTATSIANGNWTNPLTWNCTCVPVNGYTVVISNSITLNTSMIFNTGGITILNSGTLVQDASLNRDIWINGGFFNNNGKADFRYFAMSLGSGFNAGTFTVSAFTNSVGFSNSGSLKMDSMYVAGTFTNTTSGQITGDSLTIAAGFINNGRVNVTWSLNNNVFVNNNYHGGYAFTNANIYSNSDSLILSGSVWNKALFTNSNTGKVRLTKNFHNYHPSTTAVFNNNGNVTVLDSWYNTDTVKGMNMGYFQVADTSANSGFMKGNFTFCDLTPATSSVDLNSGSIASGINFSCVLGIKEHELATSNVYPNPSNGIFNIESDITELGVMITDVSGRIVLEKTIPTGNNEIELNYADGVYFVRLTDKQSGKSVTKKLVIQN